LNNHQVDPALEADRLLVAARILGRNAAYKFQEELDKITRLGVSSESTHLTEAAYEYAKRYFEAQAPTLYRPPVDFDAAK
jgi:hypothetical protein